MPLIFPEPPNVQADVLVNRRLHTLTIRYNGRNLFEGTYSIDTRVSIVPTSDPDRIEQSIVLSGSAPSVDGTVTVTEEAFAAETLGPQQDRFPEVRTSFGPSANLRNNAIYDRGQDALLNGPPDGATLIEPLAKGKFHFQAHGPELRIVFRPRYYQKHKNISFFEPWKRPVRQDSIAGWCSWWAYRDSIDEKSTLATADVFARKLKDFGFDTIQLDDGYESGQGAPPDYWLKTNAKFPSGLAGLAHSIAAKGLRPGIWVGTQIFDEKTALAHPDWFVRDPDGKAHKGPWIGYGVDGNNPAALKNLFQPVFSEFKRDGFEYVKVDSLRHLLYDSLYPCRPQMMKEGSTPEKAFRAYLQAARDQLGERTYLLACWGVLPEVAGIADACRLGGDGFGPSTMLQYNSWNNVVWRNDPDHVDINGEGEDIIRPTLVSMAGAQLLLSDKAEFYEQDGRLEGAKRAGPIPFTLPGQLYDFDPSKTDNLILGKRNQNGGSNAGPIDADQRGPECQWWQMDVSRPFEYWTVLARLSWHELPEATVKFADLGLAPGRFAVYEFWSKRYLGEFEDSFPAVAQGPKGASVYCIRRVLSHPQVVSTSRHITQGAEDIETLSWDPVTATLSGRSRVVKGDPYEVRIRAGDQKLMKGSSPTSIQGDLVLMQIPSKKTGSVDWWVQFKK